MSINKGRINKLREKIKQLNTELDKYKTLSNVYSFSDYQVSNEYEKKILSLSYQLASLMSELQEVESA